MASPTAAHQRYRNASQIIVPGVTTVIGLLAKPALVGWAWRLGMAGEDMNKVKDLAADIGTATHYLIECFLTGQEPELDHFTAFTLREAHTLFNTFKRWHGRQEVETLASEIQLVSEAWQFGGTIDWVAKLWGEVTLLDFKTSTGVYAEAQIQMAAYWQMWNETHPDLPIERVVIIHLDKKTHQLTPHTFDDLTTEWDMFVHLRALYVHQRALRNASKARPPTKSKRLTQPRRV